MNVFRSMARLYMTALERQPMFTKSATSSVMYAGGDLLAQCVSPDTKNKPFDWNRVGVFAAYGFAIAGPLYHLWYSNLSRLPHLMMEARKYRQRLELRSLTRRAAKFGIELPKTKLAKPQEFGKRTYLVSKVLADQFIFSPAYLGAFFYGTGLMSGRTLDECTTQIKDVFVTTFIADCAIWPIVQYLNFSLVSPNLQPLVVNSVNVVWNAFLSFMAHSH